MSAQQQFPTGWNEARILDLIAHYDAQAEDEQADEIETAIGDNGVTMVAVPVEMADEVRALITRRQSA